METERAETTEIVQKGRRRWIRRVALGTLGTIGLGGSTVAGFGYAFSVPPYRGATSDHFDGKKFFNPGGKETGSFGGLLKWITNRDEAPWPEFDPIVPGPPPPRRVDDLRVTFVNHSTVLIQTRGMNILTDPVWSERASPVSWAGPIRHRPPGIRFDDLPPIDVVLQSHNHYDHLDTDTFGRLIRTHTPRIYTPLGNSAFLRSIDVANSYDMDWWDGADLGNGLRLTCVPAWHFSGRGLFDRNTTLWSGFVLEGPTEQIYFAGDTGYGPFFEEIARRFTNIRLALLPIGAYRPRWFMSPVHMGPDEAVRAHQVLNAAQSMGIHFGTFALADDGDTEPIDLLNRTLDEQGIPRHRFRALAHGEGWDVEPLGAEAPRSVDEAH